VDEVCWAETNLVWSIARCFSRCSMMVHASSKIDSSTLLIRLKIQKKKKKNWVILIIEMNLNGCGNSSNINAGSNVKSVFSFNSPCRDGIGIDCSLSIIRSLEKKFPFKFNRSSQFYKLCRRILFRTTLNSTHDLNLI
jgi:hypothetical protein